jgi:sterol desaturase/sphingolipid hydroxylase (fatty acid hydroxylase superfamily)
MKPARRPPHQHLQLFENRFFEFFTVFPLSGFLVLWPLILVAIGVTAAFFAPTWWAPVLAAAGWLAWTAVEYALHRFVFHLHPRSERLQQIVFVIHGNHHADPNDPLRNLMPPIVSLPLGALIWAACVYLAGPQASWFFLGFVFGYVVYDLVHYCCHQSAMKGPLARMLKTHHMRHHFYHVEGNFAITGMIWDRLLSTRIASHKAEV